MKCWLIAVGEPLPTDESRTHLLRTSMLADILHASGHEVLWWTSTFDHALKRVREVGHGVLQYKAGYRIGLISAPRYSHNVDPMRLVHHVATARGFSRMSQSESEPDVLVCSMPTIELTLAASKYAASRRLPIVVDVRDLWPDIYLTVLPRRLRRLARLALGLEYRRLAAALRDAFAIVAVSREYLEWALSLAGRKRNDFDGVFPLGFDPGVDTGDLSSTVREAKLRDLGFAQDSFVAVFAGTFGRSCDLDTVVHAAKLLQASGNSKVRFLILGDGNNRQALEAQASDLSNIRFAGWVGSEELCRCLRSSSVGLAAYVGDALQSLPNKVFGYISAGLPIVSSLRGEMESLMKEHDIGAQYDAGSPESLVSALNRLCTLPPGELHAMKMRSQGLWAEHFSADKVYAGMAKHLECLVKESRFSGGR